MPLYHYRGRDPQGNAVSGEQDATNEVALADFLQQRGITPVAIQLTKSKTTFSLKLPEWRDSVSIEELVMFCRQMYALAKAGVPILRAIGGLELNARSNALKMALASLRDDLSNGKPMSQSMKMHPEVFDPLFVAIINVGENTGRLDEAFLQLTGYYELEMETRKRIKTALRYPTFVVIALAIAMVILNIFVIPTFAGIFTRFGAELPWATRVLMTMSAFFVHYWYLIAGGLFGIFLGVKRWLATPKGKRTWHRWQLRLPIVGSILHRALMGRFSRSFAMMLRTGVPVNQAISLVANAVDNAHIEAKVREMRTGVERGESLLINFTRSALFTPLVIQMVAVGEETGQVDTMMHEVAEYYEREVDYDLKTLTAKIEPILIVMVAGMVLILALGIFTPMWDMMNVFKGK